MWKSLVINVLLNVLLLVALYAMIKAWQGQMFWFTMLSGFFLGVLVYLKVVYAKYLKGKITENASK